MARKKRIFITVLSSLLGYISVNELYHQFNRAAWEDSQWIGTSTSLVDRKACQWFGLCGASHLRSEIRIGGHTQRKVQHPLQPQHDEQQWTSGKSRPEEWSDDERVLRVIPDYVFEYAPLVHLYSGEEFWPGDITEHLVYTTAHLNYTPVKAQSDHPNLTNLNELNEWDGGRYIYLKSDDDVEDRPDWLGGEKNIPKRVAASGQSKRDDRTPGGRSDAPAVLVVVDKGHGIVDAFWFYFYSFNQGNMVLNVRFGNHVGDWEHSMVRFEHGEPQSVFLSEHSFGQAYTYEAIEKIGKRVRCSSSRFLPRC